MKYMLITDDDDHWYIIPKQYERDWYGWLEDPEMPYNSLPDWAVQVDGPHAVTFSSYLVKL